MLTRLYDSYLEISIQVSNVIEHSMCFDSSWKLKDALAWMYDTYSIDEDKVSCQTCTYVKRFKLKNNGNYSKTL